VKERKRMRGRGEERRGEEEVDGEWGTKGRKRGGWRRKM
jgi:hypothetical protein